MIINGDCFDVMRTYPDNYFSGIVTDPPYGLGFMGKDWDAGLPHNDIWSEALRICKPGSMILCFGGTRTFHKLTCAIEDAGWEIRDCIMWLYGSGFPKSHNFGRIMGDDWFGYGTALKPAWEPIIVAMKPLDGTFLENASKWGVAGLNIDASRIGTDDTRAPTYSMTSKGIEGGGFGTGKMDYSRDGQIAGSSCGRWPANLLLDESAAQQLDEMTGISKITAGVRRNHNKGHEEWGKGSFRSGDLFSSHADSGGASRFFYCAKASSAERNEGCVNLPLQETGVKNESGRGFSETDPYAKRMAQNNHPTVKPLRLMQYLLRLITPPSGGIILDPFAGSGSTVVAAKRIGIECVGIEKSTEYCEIARARVEIAIYDKTTQNATQEHPQLEFPGLQLDETEEKVQGE